LPETDLINVALFPIPNVVAFPGTSLPLHVFEPRYRQLVHDCVEHRRMVGVCHTVKTIHQPAKTQSLEEALNSNQATYKPQSIFSAGDCEIVDTTDDGRIIASIAMRKRLLLVDEIQSLPYRIVSCQLLLDDTTAEDATTERDLQQSINSRLI
jgi:Lon protease-like protein